MRVESDFLKLMDHIKTNIAYIRSEEQSYSYVISNGAI